MRALVTGGAGFIGSNLVDALLARDDEVVVVDDLSSGKRENLDGAARLVELDIRAPELADVFVETRPQVCFHLAAQADVPTSVARPDFDAEVNVVGTVRVLQAAGNVTEVVLSSTGGAIYGECERPARENDPRRPLSPYGVAKLSAEEYVAGWNRLHGTRHAALRLANVYGPRQEAGLEGGVVAIFLDAMAAGRETAIFGGGRQTRDFVHVDDVVRALVLAPGTGRVFNVGSGVETSVLELHERCRSITGDEREPREAPARQGDVLRASSMSLSLDASSGGARRSRSTTGSGERGSGSARRSRKEAAAAGRRDRPPWSIPSPRPSSSARGALPLSSRRRSPQSSSCS